MNYIEEIRTRLAKYPHISYTEKDNEITISGTPESGFDITVCVDDSEITVYFEGWHEHFELAQFDQALSCIRSGLTDACRIRVESKGNRPYKWTLEYNDQDWEDDTTTGLLFFPFWKKTSTRYLQNNLIQNG